MLKKAPKLKHTIKSKATTSINIRPASEAMVNSDNHSFSRFLWQSEKAKKLQLQSVSLTFVSQIELITLVFLNGLAEEAKAKAFEEKTATIRPHHLKAVSKVSSEI